MLIWYQNVLGFLLDIPSFAELLPDKSMSLEAQLNAVMRFALLYAVVVLILKRNPHSGAILYVPIIVGALTFLIYRSHQTDTAENFHLDRHSCVLPTPNNPFMNVAYTDYEDYPDRPKACDVNKECVKQMLADAFDKHAIRDVDDIFNRRASDRAFHTTPVTTIPNDQDAFAKWLYHNPPTEKEKTLVC